MHINNYNYNSSLKCIYISEFFVSVLETIRPGYLISALAFLGQVHILGQAHKGVKQKERCIHRYIDKNI